MRKLIAVFLFFYVGIVFADEKVSLVEKADEYFAKMNFKKALELYKKELKNSTQNAYLYKRIANCYEQMGDKKKAFENYDLAIKMDKYYLAAYYEKALFLINDLDNKKDALSLLEKAVKYGYKKKSEKNVLFNMYVLMGYISVSEKEYKKAEKFFTKALYYKLSPKAFMLRGDARFALGKYRLAKIDYEKAVRILDKEKEDDNDDLISDIKDKIKECLKFLKDKNEKQKKQQ